MLVRISVHAFTSHVLALLCIGLRRSFYHFRCWLCFWWWLLWWWWGPLWLSRVRYRLQGVCPWVLHVDADIILYCYVLRDLYTLSTVFIDTLYEIFWVPACASLYTFADTIVYYFYDGSLTACEAIFWKWFQRLFFRCNQMFIKTD